MNSLLEALCIVGCISTAIFGLCLLFSNFDFFMPKKQNRAKEEKELYDFIETVQCHKGKILMVLTDGTSLSEEIEEDKPKPVDAYYRKDYYSISWTFHGEISGDWWQGGLYYKSLNCQLQDKIEHMQQLSLIPFAGTHINKDRIKEVKLVDVQPTEKYTLTYKKYK